MRMNADEFGALVLANEGLLYHVAYTALGSAQECPDAVQDALLKAWKNRGALKEEKAFRAWLVRIVYNSCRDRFRSRPPIPVSFDENTPFEQADNLPLQEALKSLPNDTRLSIVLYYLEGMKVSEVAQAQGVSEGTVKSRLSRGRTMLKGLLTEEEHENE